MPITKSTTELQRNIEGIRELCRSTSKPVYITRNGEPDLVVMTADAFDATIDLQERILEREMRVLEGIEHGQSQIAEGRFTALADARKAKAAAHA